MVFCADDRSDVDEHVWPYQTHGYIETKYADGTTEWGTGTLINDHHVLTAGHCIFSERVKYTNPLNPQRTWADTVKFYPAHDHERSNSNKWFAAHALLSNSKWVNDKDDAHDYGMIVLKSSAGKEFGWMGLLTTEKSDRLKKPDMTISGYPRDILKYRYTQRAAVAKLDKVTPEFLLYEIDTEKGQSGAPIWARFSYTRDELAIGIHTDVTSDKNRGVRLTRPIFDHYVEWIEKW